MAKRRTGGVLCGLTNEKMNAVKNESVNKLKVECNCKRYLPVILLFMLGSPSTAQECELYPPNRDLTGIKHEQFV